MLADFGSLVEAALGQPFGVQRHRHDKIRPQQMPRVRVAANSIREDIGNHPRRISMLVVFEVKDQPPAIEPIRNARHCRIKIACPPCFRLLRREINRQPTPFDTANTMVTQAVAAALINQIAAANAVGCHRIQQLQSRRARLFHKFSHTRTRSFFIYFPVSRLAVQGHWPGR